MKKYLVMLAASSLLVFAGCQKESAQKPYTIEGNQVVFNIAGEAPSNDNDKQTINGGKFLLFNTGDQILINGVESTVSCYRYNNSGSDAVSAYAKVSAATADDYTFYYPAQIFTEGDVAGQYVVNMPNHVSLVPNSSNYNFAGLTYAPAWPLYTQISAAEMVAPTGATTTGDGTLFQLKNTYAVLVPAISYSFTWANQVLGGNWETDEECPQLHFTNVVIYADQKITGPATIDATRPTAPTLVMSTALASGFDKVVCDLDNEIALSADANITRELGNVSVPPMPEGTTFKADIYFYVVNSDMSRTYYKYQSRRAVSDYPTQRTKKDYMKFNFKDAVEDLNNPSATNPVFVTSQATPFTID